MKKVAIIGAGSSGLASAKSCKEEGIAFTILEKSGKVAGLWNFQEDNGQASVMKSTVINSSKEMSAFSDFPPPKEFPNYMHNRKMYKYLMMYAEKFRLLEHIKYNQEVINVVQTPEYDVTGKWIVTSQNTVNKSIEIEIYDGVLICTGHHSLPYTPKFPGQEEYAGRIIHTHSIRVPDSFKDQKVLIIGTGNSALDAAVEISNVAKQVYLSTRRGAWIMFRLGPNGLPIDTQLLTRALGTLGNFVGWSLSNFVLELYLDSKFNHELYNLKPKHRFNAQHLTINDHLPNKILSGTVIVKSDVQKFSEKGVIFKGEENVTKLDTVILATGYTIKFPFLKDEIVNTTNNKVNLYKGIFPPNLKHPTLALIGLIQPFGALFPIFEIQSRWYAQLLNGKVKFADKKTMMLDIKRRNHEIERRYVLSPRHTVQVDFIPYMDEIASQFGVKPNFLKMALTDPLLFYNCYFGPCTSYQYRLEGPHSWADARQAILTTKERIVKALDTRCDTKKSNTTEKIIFMYFLSVMILCFLCFLIFRVIK
ncbi:flavin-containing monooxygenase 5 [Parasteatoda tepidariorum]|uniref:flavin-containing monooxygenase 5 n=1 Tax=Parasteatoda tepidariorum TaxID=114398 RepID=UPI001C71CDD3|nr:flavin-containing monooxygenase 5 [Parasteatoda tepidariorum]